MLASTSPGAKSARMDSSPFRVAFGTFFGMWSFRSTTTSPRPPPRCRGRPRFRNSIVSPELEHLDGKPLVIKVPAYSNSGETIELRKRGLPRQRGGGRGDVVVLLKLHMPKKVPKATRKGLETMRADLAPGDVEASILDDADERRRG